MPKSKIFFYFCSFFIGGIVFASFFNLRFLFSPIFILSIILIVFFIFLFFNFFLLNQKYQYKNFLIYLFCFLIFLGSIFYYYQRFDSEFDKNTIRFLNDGKKITILGKILSDPKRDIKKTNFILKAKEVKLDSKVLKVDGKILVKTHLYPIFKYGDEIEIYGKLKTPENFNDFDYKSYLAARGIYSISNYPQIKIVNRNKGNFLLSKLYFVKNKFNEAIGFILPEPESSLLAGLILGVRATIPQNILENFNRVGLTHIIALSGFNITIIIVALFGFFNFLNLRKNLAFLFSIVLIIFFTLMTGASASVIRAAIMGILVLVARKSSRIYKIGNAILFVGIVMLILDPRVLRYDVGFQLSFMATLGLIYLAPILKEKYFYFVPEFLSLKEVVSSTISAQIFVFPILLYTFGKVSLIALITNILVLPIIPIAMFLGFFVGIIGLLNFGFLKFLAFPVYLILFYIIKIAEVFAQIPFAWIEVKKFSSLIFYLIFIIYYFLIIRFYFLNKNREFVNI